MVGVDDDGTARDLSFASLAGGAVHRGGVWTRRWCKQKQQQKNPKHADVDKTTSTSPLAGGIKLVVSLIRIGD